MVAEAVPLAEDKLLKTYKVAFQRAPGAPMQLYTFREYTAVRTLVLIKALANTRSMTTFTFLEVHEILPGGEIKVVYGNMNDEWPKVAVHVKGDIIKGRRADGSSVLEEGNNDFNVGTTIRSDSGPNWAAARDYKATPIEAFSNVRPMKLKVA